MTREVPEPWAAAMISNGFVDQRRRTPHPSLRRLADAVGVHTTTVGSMVFGERRTDEETMRRVADAFRVPPERVREWVVGTGRVVRPYTPPAVASLLSADQRKLVDALIRQLVHATDPDGPPVG